MEYLQNLSYELIKDAEECSGRYTSPVKLRQIYRNLLKWKKLCLQMEEMEKNVYDFGKVVKLEPAFIHFLLERCYWVRYGDSEMVTDLLKMLFEVDGHLGKIFDFQLLSVMPQKRKVNSGGMYFQTTWSEEALSKEDMQPFHYFLEHSTKMKTLFEGDRLIERFFVQSISSCRSEINLNLPPSSRMFISPEILMTFLQYGLFANSDPDENVIGKLLTGVIGVILNSGQIYCPTLSSYTSKVIKAGNVLLRAVPYVRMSSLLKDQKLRNKERMMRIIVQEMSAFNLLPQLKIRCTGLPELQHLCRRSIRRVLHENWMLPRGITFLPLPTLLKGYINLQYD